MTGVELHCRHTDNHNHVYRRPADDERGASRRTGPSLLVNPTLVAEHFRGMNPARVKLTLLVQNESDVRPGE